MHRALPDAVAPADIGVRRYVPAHGLRRDRSKMVFDHLAGRAAGRVLGLPAVFPAALARTANKLRADPWARSPPVAAALRYYGQGLTLRLAPGTITLRLPDYVDDGRKARWSGDGFLDAADWSGALMPVEQCRAHVEIHELVAAELDWRSTRSYRRAKKAAQQGRPVFRNGQPLATPELLAAYFRRCVDLIRSVRKHGLLDHEAVERLGFDRPSHQGARRWTAEAAERGIGVAIDADGAVVRHLGGRHRFAVAQALQLPAMTAEVRLVHLGWLDRAAAETGEPPHRALRIALAALSM